MYAHVKRDRQTDRETGRQVNMQAGRQADRETDKQTEKQTGKRRNRPTKAERRTDWCLITNSNREKWNDCGGGGGSGFAGEREGVGKRGGDKTGTRTEKTNRQIQRQTNKEKE